jgi:hypothetical protein
LERALADNRAIPSCVAQHVFTYALGRAPRVSSGFDDAIVSQISQSFTDSGQLFPKLVRSIIDSDVFFKREDEATTP